MASQPDEQFRWRDTYFVWFSALRRPLLAQVTTMIRSLDARFEMYDPEADQHGFIESLTVRSAGDHAALEIDYTAGADLGEDGADLALDLQRMNDTIDLEKLRRLRTASARFDVMLLEQVDDSGSETDSDTDEDDLLDPSPLMIVVEGLVRLTEGVGVDPQTGTLL
jgi:hypothetical protein